MNNNDILNKYIDLIDKGYCSDCNELNCIDNFPHAKITHAIRELQQENQSLKKENKILKENAEHNDKVVDKVNWENMLLKKENKELKEKYLNAVADYETTMFEKEQLNSLVNSCQEEIRQLKKQLEDISEELELIRCDLHNRTSERDGYERQLNECLSQQKEFIKYLEDEIKRINPKILDDGELNLRLDDIKYTQYLTYKEVLQKYKSIIGDDK